MRVVIVFENDRDPVQRSDEPLSLETGIESTGTRLGVVLVALDDDRIVLDGDVDVRIPEAARDGPLGPLDGQVEVVQGNVNPVRDR